MELNHFLRSLCMSIGLAALVLMGCIATSAIAEEANDKGVKVSSCTEGCPPAVVMVPNKTNSKTDFSSVRVWLAIEGMAGFYSYLAVESPDAYIGTMALISTFFGASYIFEDESRRDSHLLAASILSGTLAARRASINNQEMSGREIAKSTFIDFNIAAALAFATEYLMQDKVKEVEKQKISIHYLPEPQGRKLLLSYQF
ncbi:MAG: hypothetical protein HOP24_07025 [Sideroxydans sp.]|nr:hypothetical protein [Sideroxydans sp.]